MGPAGARAPLVSVVIPTHDRSRRLNTAIDSVLAQSYERLEVIVVDDASTSPVEQAIATSASADPRLRVIRSEENLGASAARNKGLASARGDLVAFLDDDDVWASQKAALQVEYLESHPEAGIVTCDYVIARDERGSRSVRFRGPDRLNTQHLLWANLVGGFSFVMARRSVLGEELSIDESFPTVEDWDLWLRCSLRAPVGVVAKPLAVYVSHEETRLTDHLSTGLELFAKKHGSLMSPECEAFHRAHREIEGASGISRRLAVAKALVSSPRSTSAVLLREQAARQVGRLTRDPGLTYRALAKAVDRRS